MIRLKPIVENSGDADEQIVAPESLRSERRKSIERTQAAALQDAAEGAELWSAAVEEVPIVRLKQPWLS